LGTGAIGIGDGWLARIDKLVDTISGGCIFIYTARIPGRTKQLPVAKVAIRMGSLTVRNIAKIKQAIIDHDGIVSKAAESLGVQRKNLSAFITRHDLRTVTDEARHEIKDVLESGFFAAIRNQEPWAIKFGLTTLCKDRGYVERIEQTGAEGGPVEVKVKYADLPEWQEPTTSHSNGHIRIKPDSLTVKLNGR